MTVRIDPFFEQEVVREEDGSYTLYLITQGAVPLRSGILDPYIGCVVASFEGFKSVTWSARLSGEFIPHNQDSRVEISNSDADDATWDDTIDGVTGITFTVYLRAEGDKYTEGNDGNLRPFGDGSAALHITGTVSEVSDTGVVSDVDYTLRILIKVRDNNHLRIFQATGPENHGRSERVGYSSLFSNAITGESADPVLPVELRKWLGEKLPSGYHLSDDTPFNGAPWVADHEASFYEPGGEGIFYYLKGRLSYPAATKAVVGFHGVTWTSTDHIELRQPPSVHAEVVPEIGGYTYTPHSGPARYWVNDESNGDVYVDITPWSIYADDTKYEGYDTGPVLAWIGGVNQIDGDVQGELITEIRRFVRIGFEQRIYVGGIYSLDGVWGTEEYSLIRNNPNIDLFRARSYVPVDTTSYFALANIYVAHVDADGVEQVGGYSYSPGTISGTKHSYATVIGTASSTIERKGAIEGQATGNLGHVPERFERLRKFISSLVGNIADWTMASIANTRIIHPYEIIPAPEVTTASSRWGEAAIHSFEGALVHVDEVTGQRIYYCFDGPEYNDIYDDELRTIPYQTDFRVPSLRDTAITVITPSVWNENSGRRRITPHNSDKTHYEIFAPRRFDPMPGGFPLVPNHADLRDVELNLAFGLVRNVYGDGYNKRSGSLRTEYDAGPRLISVHVDSFYLNLTKTSDVLLGVGVGDSDDDELKRQLRFTVEMSRQLLPEVSMNVSFDIMNPVKWFIDGTEGPDLASMGARQFFDYEAPKEKQEIGANFSATTLSRWESELHAAGIRSSSEQRNEIQMYLPIRYGMRSGQIRLYGGRYISPIDHLPDEPRREYLSILLVPFRFLLRRGEPGPPPPPPEPPLPDVTPDIPSIVSARPSYLTYQSGAAAFKGSPDPASAQNVLPHLNAAIHYTARPDVPWEMTMTKVDADLPAYPPNGIPYGRAQVQDVLHAQGENANFNDLIYSFVWRDEHQPDNVRIAYTGTERQLPASGMFYLPRPKATARGVRFPAVVDPLTFVGHLTRPVFTFVKGDPWYSVVPTGEVNNVLGLPSDRPEGIMNALILQRGERTEHAVEGEHLPHAVMAIAAKKASVVLDDITARLRFRQNRDTIGLGGEAISAGPFETNPPSDAVAGIAVALAPADSPSNPADEGVHPYYAGLHYSQVATVMAEPEDPDQYHVYLRSDLSVTFIGYMRRVAADGTSIIDVEWGDGRSGHDPSLGFVTTADLLSQIGNHRYWRLSVPGAGSDPFIPAVMRADLGDQFIFTASAASALGPSVADPVVERPGMVLGIMAGGNDMSGARCVARTQVPSVPGPTNGLELVTASWDAAGEFDLVEARAVLFVPWVLPIGSRFVVIEFGPTF